MWSLRDTATHIRLYVVGAEGRKKMPRKAITEEPVYGIGELRSCAATSTDNTTIAQSIDSAGGPAGDNIYPNRGGNIMKTTTHLRRWLGITLLGVVCTVVITPTEAQVRFQRTYSNNITIGDYGESVRQTSDGGYIQAGHRIYPSILPNLTSNLILSKTTSTGAVVWTRNLTELNSQQHEKAYAVREIVVGGKSQGYIVVGSTTDDNGSKDALMIRTDASGNILWRKVWGASGVDDEAMNVEVLSSLPNVEFIVTGYADLNSSGPVPTGQRILLLRLDQTGGKIWERTYGLSFLPDGSREVNVGRAVTLLSDGDFAVAAYVKWNPPGITNIGPAVLKVRGIDGGLRWGHVCAITPDHPESFGVAQSVIENQFGNIIVTGSANIQTGTNSDIFLAEFNPTTGNVNWFHTYDCSASDEIGYDVTVPSIGGGEYVVSGITNGRVFQMLVSSSGALVNWAKQYTFAGATIPNWQNGLDLADASVRMMRTADNGFVLEANGASSTPRFYMIKTDFLGHSDECELPLSVSVDQFDPAMRDLVPFPEEGGTRGRESIVNNFEFVQQACNPAELVKPTLSRSSEGPAPDGIALRSNTVSGGSPIELIFPGNADATVRVVDMSGRTVYSENLTASAGSMPIATEGWSSGIYRVEVTSNGSTESWSVSVVK